MMAERSGVFFMLLIWHRIWEKSRGCVPLFLLSHQEGGGVAVVSDDVTEAITDLSVSELFGQIQAKQHGTIQVGRGFVFLRSRGANDFVSHAVMMPRIRGQWGKWWTPARLAQPLSSDTNPYQQKYNTTNP